MAMDIEKHCPVCNYAVTEDSPQWLKDDFENHDCELVLAGKKMQEREVRRALFRDMHNAKTTDEKVHIANQILDIIEKGED
jgi:hypothetical protein